MPSSWPIFQNSRSKSLMSLGRFFDEMPEKESEDQEWLKSDSVPLAKPILGPYPSPLTGSKVDIQQNYLRAVSRIKLDRGCTNTRDPVWSLLSVEAR